MSYPVLVAFVAVLPGLVAWWTGRRLEGSLQDPALPELLLARRQRFGAITMASLVIVLLLAGEDSFWAIPLMLVSLSVGGYPLRRALGTDTAGVAVSVWRYTKGVVASLGFWILLAWTPQIVLAIPAEYRLATLALVPLLWAWDHWSSRIWLWVQDARLIVNDEIAPRVAVIAERAGMRPPPSLYAVGLPGTRYVNALALPSVRNPSIVLGNALVELLEPDEVAAIYAHELSHLEQHGPRMMRRWHAMTRFLLALAVALPLTVARLWPEDARWVAILWPVIVLLFLAQRGRGRRQRETESDLRAAALCGDPELVARALIKVHVHGLIPRRWSVNFERGASHPSLARRIQALRGETAAAPAHAPIIMPTAREGTVLAFDDAHAYWFDGVPSDTSADLDALRARATSVRSVAWAELLELRVSVVGAERALVAAHRNGDRWSVPLDPQHVGDVQRALDRVDVRLHRELGKRPFPNTRVVAALILFTMLWSTEIGVLLIPAALAAFRPSVAALAAMGSMAIGTAVLDAFRDAPFEATAALPVAILAALGALALALAWHTLARDRTASAKRREHRIAARPALVVLGAAALMLGLFTAGAAGELPLLQIVRLPTAPALGVTLLGFGAALFVNGTRAAVGSAGASTLAGILISVPAAASAGIFGRTATISRATVKASEIARIAVPASVVSAELSPDGQRLLIRHYDNNARPATADRYTVRSLGGSSRTTTGVQLAFADDRHVLALRRAGDSLSLQLETADSATAAWSVTLPPMLGPRLRVSPHERSWFIVGQDDETDSLIVVSGHVDSAHALVKRLKPVASALGSTATFNVGSRIIVPSYDLDNLRLNPFSLLAMMTPRTTLWEITASGRRRVGEISGFPLCGEADDGYAACVVRQRRQSEIWTLADTGAPTLVGRLSLDDVMRATPGPGRRVTAVQKNDAVIVDAVRGVVTRVRLPKDSGYAVEARSVPGRLAVLRRGPGGATVVVYRIP